MKFEIFVLFAILSVFCGKPSMKSALRNKVVTDFKDALVPIVYKQIAHIVLPDVHTSHDGFDIDITNIHIDISPIQPNQIFITFMPGTSIIKFGGNNFALVGAAHAHVKYHFISKSADIDVSINELGFEVEVELHSNSGKPNIAVRSLHINLEPKHVHVHIKGDILNKILEFLANLVKDHYCKGIIKEISQKLPPIVTTEVNKRLNTLPTDISLSNSMAMKYGFPYAPNVKNDYLHTGISAYIHPKNKPSPPPYEPEDMPEFEPNFPRGIQFFMSDYVIKSSLTALHELGFLALSFEKQLLGHDIHMTCHASKTPEFDFDHAIVVDFQGSCDVIINKDPHTKFSIITELHANLKEYIKHAELFFGIHEFKIIKLEYKQDHPIDIEWFKKGINQVLELIRLIINGEMGNSGIPLPTIHGVDYTDSAQEIKKKYMMIGVNPVFHFE